MPRVFIGIPLSPELQRQVTAWQEAHRELPVRWLAPKNLHITLVPPWQEIDVPKALRELSQRAKRHTPFPIRFTRVTFGPNPRAPRLIWATGDTPKELAPLLLHATLARFRPEDFPAFPVRKLDESVAWDMTVDRIVLFESRLSPRGAEYEILGEAKL